MISPVISNHKRFAKCTHISTRFLCWIQPDFKVAFLLGISSIHKIEKRQKTTNSKTLHTFIPYFLHLWTFIAISLTGYVDIWLGCTKTWSHAITIVLHWRLPDLHIFDTDPFLLKGVLQLLIKLPNVVITSAKKVMFSPGYV